jgi:hypothetical protein
MQTFGLRRLGRAMLPRFAFAREIVSRMLPEAQPMMW